MCGRFIIELTPEMAKKVFGITEIPDWPARYNIAPTQLVPVVRQRSDGTRQISMMRWGLVPAWAKAWGDGLINARAESVNEKPSFRQAFRQRRCIVPASGFYEWKKLDQRKIPHYVRMADHMPMPLAGIWELWRSPEGQALESFAILTTTANATVAPIHDRMPVILHLDELSLWLDRDLHDLDKLAPLLSAYPAERLEAHAVSPLVNSPGNDRPECILPVTADV